MSYWAVSVIDREITYLLPIPCNTEKAVGKYFKENLDKFMPFFSVMMNCYREIDDSDGKILKIVREYNDSMDHKDFNGFDDEQLMTDLETNNLSKEDFDPKYYKIRRKFLKSISEAIEDIPDKDIIKEFYTITIGEMDDFIAINHVPLYI
jgi:hypothetical protein